MGDADGVGAFLSEEPQGQVDTFDLKAGRDMLPLDYQAFNTASCYPSHPNTEWCEALR